MIALLNSYAELLNKLDTTENSEIINKAIKDFKNEIIIYENSEMINKAIKDFKNEIIIYEENYPSSIFIIKKLINLKNDNTINLTPVKDVNKIYGQLKKSY